MHDLDPGNVADAVIAQMAKAPDPRLREVMESLVWHLHAFAHDVSLTSAEWLAAVGFLTHVGQASTPHRQEFILLSDVLGLSRVVGTIDDAQNRAGDATASSLLGPFHREAAPEFARGDSIGVRATGGPEVAVFGRVVDDAGHGVAGASIEVRQADWEGAYDLQAHGPPCVETRGRFTTGADGSYAFRTVRPPGHAIPMGGPVGRLLGMQGRHGRRPANIGFLIGAPGHRELATALYFGGDDHIASDTAFGVAGSLVVTPAVGMEGSPHPHIPSVRYDFRLAKRAKHGASGQGGADPPEVRAR